MTRIELFTTLLIILVATPLVIFLVPQLFGLDAYVVTSGSMEPSLPEGSIIYNHEPAPSTLEVGDVVTYVPSSNQSDPSAGRITHRIVEVREQNETREFKTQGDANMEPDPGWVSDYQIVGRKSFSIPYVGYAVMFLSSPLVLFLLLIVPALILLTTHIERLHEELTESSSSARILETLEAVT